MKNFKIIHRQLLLFVTVIFMLGGIKCATRAKRSSAFDD